MFERSFSDSSSISPSPKSSNRIRGGRPSRFRRVSKAARSNSIISTPEILVKKPEKFVSPNSLPERTSPIRFGSRFALDSSLEYLVRYFDGNFYETKEQHDTAILEARKKSVLGKGIKKRLPLKTMLTMAPRKTMANARDFLKLSQFKQNLGLNSETTSVTQEKSFVLS